MKQSNKHIVLTAVTSAALLLASFGAVRAYLTYRAQLVNSFTVGENSITVEEDYEPPKELVTGENFFKKQVTIKNTGNVPCYVRVYLDFSDGRMKELSELTADGKTYYPAAEYHDHLPNGWDYYSETDELGPYYYYTEVLKPGASTPPLIERVKTTITDPADLKEFEIFVYAESVQTLVNRDDGDGGFTAVPANHYKQAWTEFFGKEISYGEANEQK